MSLRSYNCYSFAMGITDEWLCSIHGVKELELVGWSNWKYVRDGGDINKLIEIFVEKDVLKRFPNLRVVNFDEIDKRTTLIAVKLAKDDFHFMKRFPSGIWEHKRGGGPIETISEQEVLADTWFGQYNSKTIFLAYKEDCH